jgi:RimJ/RimL family protein N-acetyltransferase
MKGLKTDIRPFYPEDLMLINLREHERDLALGCAPGASMDMVTHNTHSGDVLTVLKKGSKEEIIMIAGLNVLWPGVAEIWTLTGEPMTANPGAAHEAGRFLVLYWFKKHNLRRMQATVKSDFEKAAAWIERLNFYREGVMLGYGMDGADYYRYARLRK